MEVRREKLPLWEEKWNEAELRHKRATTNAREFDRGYRQYAISDEDLLWSDKWIEEALDRTTKVPSELGEPFDVMHRFAGFDLAIADAEKQLDYTVLLSIAVAPNMHRYVIGMEHLRGLSFQGQCELVQNWHLRFNYTNIAVESVGYQQALVNTLRDEKFPVTGLHTGHLQKVDLEVGIPSVAAEWEQGLWHLPWGDARSKRILTPLIEELRVYTPATTGSGFDDCVMALFFAREAYRVLRRPTARIRSLRL